MRRDPGFSLIEILMAVLIAGTVAAIAVPVFNGQRLRAKDHAAMADLDRALTAARSVHSSTEDLPADLPAKIAATESTLQTTDNGPSTAGQVSVRRVNASRAELRTTSRSGRNLLLVLDDQGNVERYISPAAGAATVTNSLRNPSFEYTTNPGIGWSAAWLGTVTGQTFTAPAGDAVEGSRALRISITGGSDYVAFKGEAGDAGGTPIPCAAGDRVNVGISGKVQSGAPGDMMIGVQFWNGAVGTSVSYAPAVTNPPLGRWIRLSHTATCPAGVTGASIRLYLANPSSGPLAALADAAQLVAAAPTSDPIAYVDGDQPGSSWTGTAQASPSQGPLLAAYR